LTPSGVTRKKTLLVSCANLHAGGGVAVATSFLNILSRTTAAERVTVLCSSEVEKNLLAMSTPVEHFSSYYRFDQRGIRALWQRKPVRYRDFDVIFTVFGPQYALPLGSKSVVGMAQAWIVYPRNAAYTLLPSLRVRVLTRLKYEIQALFFWHAQKLVVEQEHVRIGLRKRRIFRDMAIELVPNAVDSAHLDESSWQPVSLPASASSIKLGVVARNSLHKNLQILPEVKDLLLSDYELDVDIFVTLPDEEWANCPKEFTSKLKNAGQLNTAQTPSFYAEMDGVIFPSLLECYSATPIEALAAGKPLFASNLPFIRDTVGQHGYHFDPLDVQDIAETIARYFNSGSQHHANAAVLGRQHVAKSTTAEQRASAYLVACGLSPLEDETPIDLA
jgi:glycosyltransferase involved in cell wall biosynthesis